MHRQAYISSILIGSSLLILSSCYQKKGAHDYRAEIQQETATEADTIIENFDPNSVEYVDTFQLISTKQIFQKLKKNARKTTKYKLPVLEDGDSLETFTYIEQLAVTNVYASIGELSKNKLLLQSSLKLNEDIISKVIEDTSIVYPIKTNVDSLTNWTEFTMIEHGETHEWVYFEAIQWLENLYLSIENPANHINKKKLQELVELQIDNGMEMLQRLSAYQDYEPIVIFSDLLINILDCKYFTFDVTEIRELVIDTREQLYIHNSTAKK